MKRFTYFNTKPVNPLSSGNRDTKVELAKRNSAAWKETFSWIDFNKQCMLGHTPDVLICGVSQIFETSIDDFLSAVYSIINTHGSTKRVSLCVPANNELEYRHIEQLRSRGFKGIHPISAYYGVDEAAKAMSQLLNHSEHWPEHIINDYKKRQHTPIVIGFNNNISHHLNISSYKFFLKQKSNNICDIRIAISWDELSLMMRTAAPSAIFFHTDMIEDSAQEFVGTLESLIKFSHPRHKASISAIISKSTPLDLIKELQETKITGIVPGFNAWGENESQQAILHLVEGIPYWPKHILDQLPKHTVNTKKHSVELSYRQQQILNLIQTKGITNQQIAEKLKIKEGTVKLHVGLLLKKYGVRNRTQLANL